MVHTGAIAVIVSGDDLSVVKNHGQTSGHSFENVVCTPIGVPNGTFVALDLGDNYPRGLHLHKFTSSKISSQVVYTFKTKHGSEAKSPAGKAYPKAKGKNYYQWSNDNNTYTELGGVVEGDDAYIVAFSSENNRLDNSQASENHNASRNVGVVMIRKDFEKVNSKKEVISDDLLAVQSSYVHEGGFFNFNGGWTPQRVAGVHWLTDYKDKNTNASRIKIVRVPGGDACLLWEQWTSNAYTCTSGIIIANSNTL